MNEVGRVGDFFVAIFTTLCKTCNLFASSLLPENFIFSFEELKVLFEFSGLSIENGNNIVYWIDFWIYC